MKTKEELEEQFRVRVDAMVMLAPNVFMSNGKTHPECGKIGKVTSIVGDNAIVEMIVDGEKALYLLLPTEVFFVLPEFFVEAKSLGERNWYEFSEIGKKITADWPIWGDK